MQRIAVQQFFFVLFLLCGYNLMGQCAPDSLDMTNKFTFNPAGMPSTSGVKYNDIWGYVDEYGNEYAIVGNVDSILVFNVTDVDNVTKVGAVAPGGRCLWRDFKVFGTRAYGSSEGSGCAEGLVVLDLSTLPDSFSIESIINTHWTKAHNIFIDVPAERLYCVGSNTVSEGMIILDLGADPANPPVLKKVKMDTLPGQNVNNNYYIHDIFVRNSIAYASHGNLGYIVWDVNDLKNIKRLGAYFDLPNSGDVSYVHSSWNTDDENWAYVATEIGNRKIYVMDQTELFDSDPDTDEIKLDTTWKEPLLDCGETPRTNNVPHNPYVKDDVLYISYYQDGVQLLDVSTPDSIYRIGYYDLSDNTTYNGTTANWGVFPFFPSGTIIATDTETGFHVLRYEQQVPLDLLSFDAKLMDRDQVQLFWNIANAINVRQFEIEHSTDGIHFEKIGVVDYLEDVYSFKFKSKVENLGTNYYRLKIIDYNGKFEYSEIRKILVDHHMSFQIVPNPFLGKTTISTGLDAEYVIKVYNQVGVLVHSETTTRGKVHSLDLESLPNGIYMIQLKTRFGTSSTKLMVKQD